MSPSKSPSKIQPDGCHGTVGLAIKDNSANLRMPLQIILRPIDSRYHHYLRIDFSVDSTGSNDGCNEHSFDRISCSRVHDMTVSLPCNCKVFVITPGRRYRVVL